MNGKTTTTSSAKVAPRNVAADSLDLRELLAALYVGFDKSHPLILTDSS